jgi:hypothetical protein
MLLPDFFKDQTLIRLKARMGIPANVYGSWASPSVPIGTTEHDRKELATIGRDVNWGEIRVLPDGTFAYKDLRVLIYIRDVHSFSGSDAGPRYHLLTCQTIDEMRAANRIERYVVATRDDGWFQVNVITNNVPVGKLQRLAVCQQCLRKLHFDGFGYHISRPTRLKIVAQFSPAQFFAKYPKSLHRILPIATADQSSVSVYSTDFQQISRELRTKRNWRCEDCYRDFSAAANQKFLHVHHINADRADNALQNLKVLCLGCHAMMPNHAHLRSSPAYVEFKQRF